jgi:hypothetical protein
VILTHEAGRDGFWLARFLVRRGVEVHVMQPSSLPVDRRARRAKTDVIDVEMLLRTLMAWLRGEPRVCSMVPINRGDKLTDTGNSSEQAVHIASRMGIRDLPLQIADRFLDTLKNSGQRLNGGLGGVWQRLAASCLLRPA